MQTYDDFMAAGRILAKQHKYVLMAGYNDANVFFELFEQAGGRILNQQGEVTLDDPVVVQALEFLVTAKKQGILYTRQICTVDLPLQD